MKEVETEREAGNRRERRGIKGRMGQERREEREKKDVPKLLLEQLTITLWKPEMSRDRSGGK